MNHSTDLMTGKQVQKHLLREGVETPFETKRFDPNKVEILFAQMMAEFGLDLCNDSLRDTPRRVAKLYGTEYFAGLDYANFPTASVVDNTMRADEIVLERNIQVRSICEHHFLPIIGSAFVAYVPEKKVLGLSKINRIVDFFCRRPQIQERLTMQIYHALAFILGTTNVAVFIQAEHLCVKTRGVEDPCSDTVTCKLDGIFRQADKRAEVIALCKGLTSY